LKYLQTKGPSGRKETSSVLNASFLKVSLNAA
jgi:hypothetical protein